MQRLTNTLAMTRRHSGTRRPDRLYERPDGDMEITMNGDGTHAALPMNRPGPDGGPGSRLTAARSHFVALSPRRDFAIIGC